MLSLLSERHSRDAIPGAVHGPTQGKMPGGKDWRYQLGLPDLTSSAYGCSKKEDDSPLIRVEIQMDNFPLPPSTWSTSKIVHKTDSESLEMSPAQLNLILSLGSEVNYEIKRIDSVKLHVSSFSDPRN